MKLATLDVPIMFKAGDKVTCIDADECLLKINEHYIVELVDGAAIYINGWTMPFAANRFVKTGSTKITGIKHDAEKPEMALLSAVAMNKIAQVMTYGKKKYAAHNWRAGLAYSRLLSASLRHIFSYIGGESLDRETGISHLAHACCCLMMVLDFETTKPNMDDRYKTDV